MTKIWTPEMARLHSMWTPEMIDRFEADVRALLEMDSKLTEAGREEIVATLKRRALDDLAQRPDGSSR